MDKISFIIEFDEVSKTQKKQLTEFIEKTEIKLHVLESDNDLKKYKKYKEVIDKAIEYIRIYRSYQKIDNKDYLKGRDEIGCLDIYQVDELLDILNEVSE